MMLVARVKWVYRTVLSIAVVPRDRLYHTSLQTASMSSTLLNVPYYIISNFFTLQQLPPWLSGKASHLYQLDMRRSLVRFGQVANFFLRFLRFKQYSNIFRSSLVLFAFVFNSHQALSFNAYSKFLLFTFAMRRSSENERHIAVLRVGTYSVDILTYTF